MGYERKPAFGKAAAPRSRQYYERQRDLDQTATDLERIVVEDTGKNLRLDQIFRKQADFAKQVMEIFRAYDEERQELLTRVTKLEVRVGILLWGAATFLVGLVGFLASRAFR